MAKFCLHFDNDTCFEIYWHSILNCTFTTQHIYSLFYGSSKNSKIWTLLMNIARESSVVLWKSFAPSDLTQYHFCGQSFSVLLNFLRSIFRESWRLVRTARAQAAITQLYHSSPEKSSAFATRFIVDFFPRSDDSFRSLLLSLKASWEDFRFNFGFSETNL